MSVRDHLFEREFLKQVADEAARRAGVDVTAYVEAVAIRLQAGASVYGDDGFLHADRDNLSEALEEGPDLAGYSVLELQRLNRNAAPPDGVHHHLFEAAVLASLADHHVRQACLARRRA